MTTYRYDQEFIEAPEFSESTAISLPVSTIPIEEVASFLNASVPLENATPTKPMLNTSVKDKRQSTFHVVSVGEWLDLVVMVKEEESRWHLRRNRLEEEEIRDFLEDLAKNLCISDIFSTRSLRELAREPNKNDKAREQRLGMLHLPRDDSNNDKNKAFTWSDEKRVQAFLATLKEIFGLKPVSPYMHDSAHSYSFYSLGRYSMSPRTPANPRSMAAARRRRLRQRGGGWVNALPESAAVLFLGQELASLMG